MARVATFLLQGTLIDVQEPTMPAQERCSVVCYFCMLILVPKIDLKSKLTIFASPGVEVWEVVVKALIEP